MNTGINIVLRFGPIQLVFKQRFSHHKKITFYHVRFGWIVCNSVSRLILSNPDI